MVIAGNGARVVTAVSERGVSLAAEVRIADTFGGRLVGVLGRRLRAGEGLLLVPCRAVHTFFLRHPLDVLFLARDGTVLAAHPGLGPWRAARKKEAWAVLELPPGALARSGVAPGERILFRSLPAKEGLTR